MSKVTSKVVKLRLEENGIVETQIRTLLICDEMSPFEIEASIRLCDRANANGYVQLFSPENHLIYFKYCLISDQIQYRLVLTRPVGKIYMLLY
jgi:hypothetical protein